MDDEASPWAIPRWRPKLRTAAVVLIWAAAGWIVLARLPIAAISYWTATLLAAAILAVLSASPPAASARVAVVRVLMALLGFLTPIAVVVGLRLSFKMCAVANLLQLPWGDTAELVVRVTALVVWAASTALIIVGFRRPALHGAAVVMFYWSLWALIPGFLLFFFLVYGDPAPNCVPV